jgi:AcrR family transcriptional regulator
MKTRDIIIDKALDLFSIKGFNGSSVRDICREVGIKESSFYNHFINKEALKEAIFDMFQHAVLNTALTEATRDKLTDQYSLREMMTIGIENFISLWADNTMSKIWKFVSMEQYKNPLAGNLILDEDSRKIAGAAATFDMLQKKGKMKPCNSVEVAHLYMYSIRAQHLDYGLRLTHGHDAEPAKQAIYATCNLFCTLYEL